VGAAAPQDSDPAEKQKKREEWSKDGGQLHTALTRLEGQVGEQFSVGGALSIADLAAYTTMKGVAGGSWDFVPTNTFERYKKLSQIYKSVDENPKVQEWYKLRAEKVAAKK
jgi:glutathione S-transferase